MTLIWFFCIGRSCLGGGHFLPSPWPSRLPSYARREASSGCLSRATSTSLPLRGRFLARCVGDGTFSRPTGEGTDGLPSPVLWRGRGVGGEGSGRGVGVSVGGGTAGVSLGFTAPRSSPPHASAGRASFRC